MTKMRSWLSIPGDSASTLSSAQASGADILVIDLENAITPQNKAGARQTAREWLLANEAQAWIRINPVGTPHWRDDLAAMIACKPHGIIVPKVANPDQLRTVAAEIYEHEQRSGIASNSTQILPIVSDTPQAAAAIAAYSSRDATMPRLTALTWSADNLFAAIGATCKRDTGGHWTDLFRMIRAQTLLTAKARGVAAIDAPFGNPRDSDGLKKYARAAYADGWTGMMATHPDQVPIINAAFTPGHQELAYAHAIVSAFEDHPGAQAIQLDGMMLDQPHLSAARAVIEQAL